MIFDEIKQELFGLRDEKYREFQAKLIPTVGAETIIGVRTPQLKAFAKTLAEREDVDTFLGSLPHLFFEENQLHAFIISRTRGFSECLAAVDRFLPYIDNWATCDQLSPKVFKKHRNELLGAIDRWIASGDTYTVRFGIKMLMEHFLEDDFDPSLLEKAVVRSEEYYIKMMSAWYFATALAKQYDAAIPYIEERRLDNWTHGKTIQKALESFRISVDKKEYLRGLRIPGGQGKVNEG